MKVLLVLCAVVAVASAGCNILKRYKVKGQWAEAFGYGTDRNAFGLALWKAIFAQAPDAKNLFTRVRGDNIKSNEFTAHIQRVLGGLDMSISLLDDEDTLNAELEHLRGQHHERSIPSNYFTAFKRAVMQVVPAQLGRCFDSQAWDACFDVIADGIKS